MAAKAGIYGPLWHPKDSFCTNEPTASMLIPPLTTAITKMEKRPKYFRKFDSPNGWGKYENFLPWLKKLLEACKEHPDAVIESSI